MPERLAQLHASAPDHLQQAFEQGVVPVDKYGVPYLIYPFDPPKGVEQDWNHDHSFFFSNLSVLNDEAGIALRHSRVQYLPRYWHDRKHNIFFRNGVEWLPESEGDKFALTVLSVAGYASRMALDLRGGEPKLVRMSSHIHDFVRGRKQLHIVERYDEHLGYRTDAEPRDCIAKFFVQYIGKQALEGVVDEKYIDQFLYSESEEDRRNMGDYIIEAAIDLAVEPIRPKYRKALGKGLLRPRLSGATEAVTEVLPRHKWPDYHDVLRFTLAA